MALHHEVVPAYDRVVLLESLRRLNMSARYAERDAMAEMISRESPRNWEIWIPYNYLDLTPSPRALARLFIVSMGWWPTAQGHFTHRATGLQEHILIYCLKGKGWFESRGKRWRVQEGDCLFVLAGEPHSYGADKNDPWGIAWAHFSGTEAQELITAIDASPENPIVRVGEKLAIAELFAEMRRAFLNGFSLHVQKYAASCLRHALDLMAYHSSLGLPRRAKDLHLEAALKYMENHLTEKLTVAAIASVVHMSVSHFITQFKAKTGFPPMDYLIRMRIQKACEYLETERNLPVSQVAQMVGYEDAYYFSRIFKKTVGHTARAHRTIHR